MTAEQSTATAVPGQVRGGLVGPLAGLSLLWLIATLVSIRQGLGEADAGSLTLARAALGLPPLISASLIAGAAVSLAAVELLTRWRPALTRRSRRWPTGAAAGVVVGLAVAVPITAGYGGIPSVLALAGAVVVAATAGGLLAGLLRPAVVGAAVVGSLAVFLVGFVVGVFDGDLLQLFGAGDTQVSVLAANRWVALLAALAAGLAAGVLSYGYLRRYAVTAPRWPAYLLAGAAPGLLLLLAEAVTRLGGAPLFRLVGAAAADDTILRFLGAARFNRALVVLFVGALVAVFLLGRALTPTEEDDRETDEDQPSTS